MSQVTDKHAVNYIPPEVVEQELMERPMKGVKRGKTQRDKEKQSLRNKKKKSAQGPKFKNEAPSEESMDLLSDTWVDQIYELQGRLSTQPAEIAMLGKMERVLHLVHLLPKCQSWFDLVSVTSLFLRLIWQTDVV